MEDDGVFGIADPDQGARRRSRSRTRQLQRSSSRGARRSHSRFSRPCSHTDRGSRFSSDVRPCRRVSSNMSRHAEHQLDCVVRCRPGSDSSGDTRGRPGGRSRSRSRSRHRRRHRSRGPRSRSRRHHSRKDYHRDSVSDHTNYNTRRVLTPTKTTTLVTDNSVTVSQLVQALQAISGSNNEKLSTRNAIPDFDPVHKGQTIAMWLHKVNECAIIYNWTDKQTIHFAIPKLKGLAQKWYEGLTSVMYSWQEWQDKLKLAFPSDDNYGQLLTSMLSKRARFNDSLEEYFYEKVVLLNHCSIDGKKAVDCIVFGIDDRSVRLGAQAASFKTPDQLLPYLKSSKCGINDRRKFNSIDNKADTNLTQRDNKDRNIRCFNCMQTGHYKSQCPKPMVKCDKCLRFGHTTDKCYSNKNSNITDATKTVMCINNTDADDSKYYKEAIVNGVSKKCFIDFGSSVTLIRRSDLVDISSDWASNKTLPLLKGFGDAVVHALGSCCLDIEIDLVKASVEVLIVPDHCLQVPLLIGRSYTEQPHVVVAKDCNILRILMSSEHDDTSEGKINLICSEDTIIDGVTIVPCRTGSSYTGDIYIDRSSRFRFGEEHSIVQGIFSVVNGLGTLLVEGLTKLPFMIKEGFLLARGRRADESLSNEVCKVMQIDSSTTRPITEDDVITDSSLNTDTRFTLIKLLNKYRDCFAFNLNELGKTDLVEMSINLKDNEPVVYRPYRLPFIERDKVREMVQELIDCNIVRPSSSPYASPIVLVKKKTGDIRLCVDYRALNKKTIRENYPLPRIDDQLDELAGYEFYTTLDLASGYYQLAIKENDRFKTSFVTPDGQFEFNRMPFGLANAPSNFMRMVNLVLGNSNKIASAYMDDIIVPSFTAEMGLENLEKVLMLLRQGGLTLKISKCRFFCKEVNYLGFELSKEGIRPGTLKIDAVKNFPEPTNQHGVRQFIGLCSFFRRFVKNFSMISKPLTKLLKKDANWVWGPDQIDAFNRLKEELISKPTLSLYDPKAATELHTDACKIGIAGILMQRDSNGALKPVAYYSRQTTSSEQHMTAYELETLAVVSSLQRFRVYLIGIEFQIFTDCNSLRATFLKRDLIPRVARWWIAMQEFNFTIEYRPGKAMTYVDALSRNPPPGYVSTETAASVDIMEVVTTDWLSTVQCADSEIQRKISILKDPQTIDVIDVTKNFVVKNNKLYKITDQGDRWVVPKGVRWQILKQCHDDIGHFAFDKTLSKIKETYWFSKMRRFIKKYVDSCLECAYTKSHSRKKPPLHPILKVDSPFATLHIDHVGPFVKSSKHNTHILVIIDAYTKFIILKPVKSTKTSIVVDKLSEYFNIFGVPKRIISDRGSCFTSGKFRDFLDKLGVRHVLNAVATPRANGQVERYNRTLLDSLTAKCTDCNEKKWDIHVPTVQWGLNNTVNKGIGKTPAEALFGTSLTSISEGRVKLNLCNDKTVEEKSLNRIREEINDYVALYQEKQKKNYDKKAGKALIFNEGDLVSIEREVQSSGQSKKLVPKFQGPYRIVKVLGNDRYQVEDTPITRKSGRPYLSVIAVDKMKAWLSYSRSDKGCVSSSDEGSDEDINC